MILEFPLWALEREVDIRWSGGSYNWSKFGGGEDMVFIFLQGQHEISISYSSGDVKIDLDICGQIIIQGSYELP